MKRSEMIELLLKHDDELLPMQAEDIIKFLESQGMLPPKRIKYAPTAYAEPNKKVVYEWESENETSSITTDNRQSY